MALKEFEFYRDAAGRQYSNQVIDDIMLDFMIWIVDSHLTAVIR